MNYSHEVEQMCMVAKGPKHGPAPLPEEGKWVEAKQIGDISGFTHGIGWCAPQQGACKLSLNVKEGVIEEALVETSGSAMTAAAIFKACRMGLILEEKYRPAAEKILSSLIDLRVVEKDGKLKLTGTCAVAGLGPDVGRRDGTVGYYLSEPVVDDDVKGAAALFMAYAQYLKLKKWEDGERWKA